VKKTSNAQRPTPNIEPGSLKGKFARLPKLCVSGWTKILDYDRGFIRIRIGSHPAIWIRRTFATEIRDKRGALAS
jgi:hypothetical protein